MDLDHWSIVACWTAEEAVALSFGVPPFPRKNFERFDDRDNAPFFDVYMWRLDLVERAIKAGQLQEPITPAKFIVWADQVKLKIDDKLRANVAAVASCQGSDRSHRGQLGSRERDSLLKLIIGMAVGGYGFDPLAERSRQVKEITDDLLRVGVQLSDDTVRKFLKDGAELLPKESPEG
jgi:hypothetical protein